METQYVYIFLTQAEQSEFGGVTESSLLNFAAWNLTMSENADNHISAFTKSSAIAVHAGTIKCFHFGQHFQKAPFLWVGYTCLVWLEGQNGVEGCVVKRIYIAYGKQLTTKTSVQHSMKMTYWTAQTEVADILLTQTTGMSAQTQVGTFFPVNKGHNMNSLSANSKHWYTSDHGDRVGKEWGLVVGVVGGAHQIIIPRLPHPRMEGIILTGQCQLKNSFNSRMK